jgi:hypothetical protein
MSDRTLTTDEVVKHTPGPWHWDSDPVKNDPTGRIRYRVCATGKTVTQVYYSSFEGGPTNAEADARLIAAAPALLDALKDLIEWQDEMKNAVPRIYLDRAQRAIAKAVGR